MQVARVKRPRAPRCGIAMEDIVFEPAVSEQSYTPKFGAEYTPGSFAGSQTRLPPTRCPQPRSSCSCPGPSPNASAVPARTPDPRHESEGRDLLRCATAREGQGGAGGEPRGGTNKPPPLPGHAAKVYSSTFNLCKVKNIRVNSSTFRFSSLNMGIFGGLTQKRFRQGWGLG